MSTHDPAIPEDPEERAAATAEARRVGSYLLRDPAFVDRYLNCVRLSMSKEDRARIAGCDSKTIRRWEALAVEARDEGREDEYTRFIDQVNQAEGERKLRHMLAADRLAHPPTLTEEQVKAGHVQEKPHWSALRFFLQRDGYYDEAVVGVKGAGDGNAPVVLRFDKQDEEA